MTSRQKLREIVAGQRRKEVTGELRAKEFYAAVSHAGPDMGLGPVDDDLRYGCKTLLTVSAGAAILGATFVANGEELSSIERIAYKAMAGVTGLVLPTVLLGVRGSYNERVRKNVLGKRSERIIERKIRRPSGSQRKGAKVYAKSELDEAGNFIGLKGYSRRGLESFTEQ